MDTPLRRQKYAELMVDPEGKKEMHQPFNKKHDTRLLVTETIDTVRPDFAYRIDERGNVGKGPFLAAAVYNKPTADVLKHWSQVSNDLAIEILADTKREIPVDQIRVLRINIERFESAS